MAHTAGWEHVRWESSDGVAILRLDRSVTNALSQQLVDDLARAVATARDAPDVCGLVLASANHKFFSIGFDLPGLLSVDRDEFAHFFSAFHRLCLDLYALPKPTVAAVTGHATAGGCILALCCDYRFLAQGRRLMGLNEVHLGVPVPHLAAAILAQRVAPVHARHLLYTGEFFEPHDLQSMGLADQVLPPERVVPAAVERARSLGKASPAAFAAIKRDLVEPVRSAIEAQAGADARRLLDFWYSPDAQARLHVAATRF